MQYASAQFYYMYGLYVVLYSQLYIIIVFSSRDLGKIVFVAQCVLLQTDRYRTPLFSTRVKYDTL